MWTLLLRKENSTVAILSTSKVRNSISMIVQLNLAAAGFGNCDSSLDGFESRFESIFSKKKKKNGTVFVSNTTFPTANKK